MTRWSKQDFLRRHAEAAERARKGDRSGMTPPAVRVVMPFEQEQAA